MVLKIVHSTKIFALKRNIDLAKQKQNPKPLFDVDAQNQIGMRTLKSNEIYCNIFMLGSFCSRFTRKTIIKLSFFFSTIIYYYKSICVRNEKWFCAAVGLLYMQFMPKANLCIGNYGKNAASDEILWLQRNTTFNSNCNEKCGSFLSFAEI